MEAKITICNDELTLETENTKIASNKEAILVSTPNISLESDK